MSDGYTPSTEDIRHDWVGYNMSVFPRAKRKGLGAAFDRWLEAERQAARNETAKAIKDELDGNTELFHRIGTRGFLAATYADAARIAAAHIKPSS